MLVSQVFERCSYIIQRFRKSPAPSVGICPHKAASLRRSPHKFQKLMRTTSEEIPLTTCPSMAGGASVSRMNHLPLP
eukprot:4331134-Heterocapsa_arctica.AAC.1